MMSEEDVTKHILKYLISKGWFIVCYDFPQSGTGRIIHPNNTCEKNKKSIIPDILCIKNHIALYFENKDYYYFPDFQKIAKIRDGGDYSKGLENILAPFEIEKIFYGIGMPLSKITNVALENKGLVDFIIGDSNGEIILVYNSNSVTLGITF